jgi:hypothetical protein
MKINFDMDGTIANLYGVQNWLEMLIAEDTTPYAKATPMVNMSAFARRLNTLQRAGYEIGVISWLSKSGGLEYNERVTEVKRKWLAKHLPSVQWDSVIIVPYGTPKELFCGTAEDILFDDEERNRESWTGIAYDVENILGILKEI